MDMQIEIRRTVEMKQRAPMLRALLTKEVAAAAALEGQGQPPLFPAARMRKIVMASMATEGQDLKIGRDAVELIAYACALPRESHSPQRSSSSLDALSSIAHRRLSHRVTICIMKLAWKEHVDRNASPTFPSRTLSLAILVNATTTLPMFDFLVDVNAGSLEAERIEKQQKESLYYLNRSRQLLQQQQLQSQPFIPMSSVASAPSSTSTSALSAFKFTPTLTLLS